MFGHEDPFDVDEYAMLGALRVNDLIDGVERINAFLSATAKNSQKAQAASRGKYFKRRRR